MSLGSASVTRNNYARDVQKKIERIKAAYSKGADAGRGSLDANTPVRTGNLKSRNRVEMFSNGLGFIMSNETPYGPHVNSGHFTRSGSFVPPNPFFSRAEADARAALLAALRSR